VGGGRQRNGHALEDGIVVQDLVFGFHWSNVFLGLFKGWGGIISV
jgi:hypothetical protein